MNRSVRHATEPFHCKADETQRQRLRLDEHSIGLPPEQRGDQRGCREAEVVRQPDGGGATRRPVQPRTKDRNSVDRLAHVPASYVPGEGDPGRIVGEAGENLDLDALAPKLARKRTETELGSSELGA
jgi:hypothetical protein